MPPSSQHSVRNNVYKAVSDEEATLLHIPQASTMNLAGRNNTSESSEAYESATLQHQNYSYNYDDYQRSSSSTSFSTYYSDNSSHHVSNFSPEGPEAPIQNISSEKRPATGTTLVNYLNDFSVN